MPVDVLAEILSNTRLAPDYNVVTFRAPQIADMAAPGQFVMVRCAQGLDPMLRRPFSIFEHVRDAEGRIVGLSILNKRVGAGTSRLYDVTAGERLSVLGPLGRPFVPVPPPEEAWMVAGGVGLAPFASLAEALAERGTSATLFYGGRSARDIYYEDFFTRLGIRLVVTTEDGSRGEKGRVTAPLERELTARGPGSTNLTIYACGPTPMMRAVAGVGAASGRRVFVSLEPVMGCGMGGCYSCVVPVQQGAGHHFVRSCIEGPVFDAHSLVWDAMTSTGH
ncbi:MAG: dihydroorotate dehydrogenase electron transfer subunit [Acidobacteriota bacterium]